jgi:hypothetical protein
VVVEMVVEPLTLQLLVVFLLTYPPSYFSLAKHIPLGTIYGDIYYKTELFVPSFFSPII